MPPSGPDSNVDKTKGILGRLKAKKKRGRGNTYGEGLGKIWTLDELADEMQRLGLEPTGLGKFITSLHKLAVASGVNPSVLASIIKDLSSLSEGKYVPIAQVREKIQRLASEHEELAAKVKELNEKRISIDAELGSTEVEREKNKDSLVQFTQLQQQLGKLDIAIEDISRLESMISSARQMGFSQSAIAELLSNLDSVRRKKDETDSALEQLIEAKNLAQKRVLALEQEIADKQKIIDSANEITGLGLGPGDLDDLSAAIRMIAKTRNIGEADAKARLIADLQSYYANDHELRSRIRTLESLVREKEEQFSKLDADLHNEKAVLDNTTKLISAGLDEQWLTRLGKIIDAYGIDVESLSEELQAQNGLRASIEELQRTKKTLVEEEKLLRQKVVAAEDQRIKTLSMINDIIVHAPRTAQAKRVEATKTSSTLGTESSDFLTSAQKSIETIRAKLPADSPARLVLEHALLALRLESNRGE